MAELSEVSLERRCCWYKFNQLTYFGVLPAAWKINYSGNSISSMSSFVKINSYLRINKEEQKLNSDPFNVFVLKPLGIWSWTRKCCPVLCGS